MVATKLEILACKQMLFCKGYSGRSTFHTGLLRCQVKPHLSHEHKTRRKPLRILYTAYFMLVNLLIIWRGVFITYDRVYLKTK